MRLAVALVLLLALPVLAQPAPRVQQFDVVVDHHPNNPNPLGHTWRAATVWMGAGVEVWAADEWTALAWLGDAIRERSHAAGAEMARSMIPWIDP